MRRIILAILAGGLLISGCSKDASNGYAVLFDGTPAVYDEKIYDRGVPIGRITHRDINPAGQVRMGVVLDEAWLRRSNENIAFYPRGGQLQVEHLQSYGAPLPKDAVLCGFTSRSGLIWFNVKTLIADRGAEARNKARELQAQFAKP